MVSFLWSGRGHGLRLEMETEWDRREGGWEGQLVIRRTGWCPARGPRTAGPLRTRALQHGPHVCPESWPRAPRGQWEQTVLRAPGSWPATRTPPQGRGRQAGGPALRQAGPPEVALWLMLQAVRAKETAAGWFKPHPQSRKLEGFLGWGRATSTRGKRRDKGERWAADVRRRLPPHHGGFKTRVSHRERR